MLQYAGLNWPEIYRSYFCSTCTILESRLVSLCYQLNNKDDPMQCPVLKWTLHFLALFVLDLKKKRASTTRFNFSPLLKSTGFFSRSCCNIKSAGLLLVTSAYSPLSEMFKRQQLIEFTGCPVVKSESNSDLSLST